MDAGKRLQFWLDEVIIGLDLCPWAAPVHKRGGLHLTTSDVASPERAFDAFVAELDELLHTQGRETTLLAFPHWVLPFPLFYDVVGSWEEELERLGLAQELQLVTFHPEFRFGGVPPRSRAHWVNRSPYPLCHFLRTADVERATQTDVKRAQRLSMLNEQKLERLTSFEAHRLFPWLA